MMNIEPLKSRDKKLVNNWYIACLSRELKSNKPIQRIIYDTPLVLFRNLQGKAVCMPDRCLHRHTLLSEGTVTNGELRCSYHGWTYNSEGFVVHVPSEGPERLDKKSHLCLKPLPVVEQDDCIWVWMGDALPKTPTPPFRFPFYKSEGFSSYFMITDFNNEVTHLAENFMDVPHTVFVHAGWFRNQAVKKIPIKVQTAQGKVLITYIQPNDTIGFTGKILNPKREPMIHTDEFITPNITHVEYHFGSNKSFIICSQITPVSTLKSRVYTEISYKLGVFTKPLYWFFRFYTRQVIEQDVRIMANQGRSFRFDMNENFKSTEADIVHAQIERLRLLAKNDDPATFTYTFNTEKEMWI